MALSKEERQSIAATEIISETISKRKEQKEPEKNGVDLVGLAEKLAARKLQKQK